MHKSVLPKLLALTGLLVSFLVFTGCGDDDPVQPEPRLSSVLDEVIRIAEGSSINRNQIDWETVRAELAERETTNGFISAIRSLLLELGDNHSLYITASGTRISASTADCSGDGFDVSSLPANIGAVKINGFSGTQEEGRTLARAIQARFRQFDNPETKGWVVDLSANLGGNMYPMIAGLGPLFNQETLGYFIGPTGVETPWGYSENGSWLNNKSNKLTTVDEPYTMSNPNVKVVVVIDNPTASSGEAAAIAFIGRPNTLILGRASCGLSTANSAFNVSNGDRFVLTVSTMADRNKQAYGGRIEPDEVINSNSALLDRIEQWMNE